VEEGVLEEKISELTERLQRDPGSLVFAQLADLYRKKGMCEEAIRVCLEGLKKHSYYIPAHMVLAKTFFDKGEFQEAEARFKKVIELDPRNTVAHLQVAQIYLKNGQFEKAIDEFNIVLKDDPTSKEAREGLEKAKKNLSEDTDTSWSDVHRFLFFKAPAQDRLKILKKLTTFTLATIFEHYNFPQKALEVYKKLAKERPQDIELKERIASLKEIIPQEKEKRKKKRKNEESNKNSED
jgi:tetratricopeptide (TPR) repeat protein